MDTENNQLTLCGVIETTPALDHEVFGEQFYRMDVRVPRLSGAQDLLPVTISERLMNSQVTPGTRLCVQGQLRSYNKVMGGAGRLLGPTGGYIAGYLFYALLAGLDIPRWQERFLGRCVLLLLGTAVCYGLGTAWFVHMSGRTLGESLSLCVLPFLPGDAAKIALAAFLTPRLRKAMRI